MASNSYRYDNHKTLYSYLMPISFPLIRLFKPEKYDFSPQLPDGMLNLEFRHCGG